MNYQEPELNFKAADSKTQGYQKTEMHKLSDGDNVFRILPPFGTNHNNVWFAEWYIHWGFQNADGREAPLSCSYRTPERYCPICMEARDLKKKADLLVRDYTVRDSEGQDKVDWNSVPEDVKEARNDIMARQNRIRSQRHFYYNALDSNGELKVLKVTPKTGRKLNDKIKEAYHSKSIQALSLTKGCYFVIKRTRTGSRAFDVEYDVDFLRTTKQHPELGTVEVISVDSVSDHFLNNFEELAFDIHRLYKLRTASELKDVMDGKGFASQSDTATSIPSATSREEPVETVSSGNSTSTSSPVTINQDDDDEQLNILKSQLGLGD